MKGKKKKKKEEGRKIEMIAQDVVSRLASLKAN